MPVGAPLIVVGAGLRTCRPCCAAKSYSERLFRYQRIDRLDRIAADQALCAPAEREEVEYEPKALDPLYEKSGGYPYFVQAYGKATWDHAPRSPITSADVRVAAPEAEADVGGHRRGVGEQLDQVDIRMPPESARPRRGGHVDAGLPPVAPVRGGVAAAGRRGPAGRPP